jgi:hypothetical protein
VLTPRSEVLSQTTGMKKSPQTSLHLSEPKVFEKPADTRLDDRKVSTEQLYLELKQKSNELNEILTSLSKVF